MRHLVAIIVLSCLCSSACSSHTAAEVAPPDAPPATGPSLPDGVVAFAGTDITLPDDDLAPLFALVGDATYIGIGESIHTSGGYYAMKDRIIRALIQDHGLRLLAMETPRLTAQPLEQYLQTCQGSATTALESIFPVFVDDHTVALMQWICQFNQAHAADPVHFFGFDEQEDDMVSAALRSWLTAAAPTAAPALLAALAPCHTASAQDYDKNGNILPYSTADYTACGTALGSLDSYITTNKAALIAASSATEEAEAELDSLSLKSWQDEDYYDAVGNVSASYEARDIAMYQIFSRYHDLHYAGAKTILWAHNYHLSADHADVVDYTSGVQTFGTQLRTAVGAAYAPIGQFGYNVSINWPGVGTGPTPTPDPGSVEAILHATAQPYLIADPSAAWLTAGAYYELGGKEQMFAVPAAQFTAMVYLETSPGMNSPYWGNAP